MPGKWPNNLSYKTQVFSEFIGCAHRDTGDREPSPVSLSLRGGITPCGNVLSAVALLKK